MITTEKIILGDQTMMDRKNNGPDMSYEFAKGPLVSHIPTLKFTNTSKLDAHEDNTFSKVI